MTTTRIFPLIEVALFGLATLIHSGFLLSGYAHRQAAAAEMVIGAVLLLGLIMSSRVTWQARWISAGTQVFALLGVMLGTVMIAIGVGPQTTPDVVYHAAISAILLGGIVAALFARQ